MTFFSFSFDICRNKIYFIFHTVKLLKFCIEHNILLPYTWILYQFYTNFAMSLVKNRVLFLSSFLMSFFFLSYFTGFVFFSLFQCIHFKDLCLCGMIYGLDLSISYNSAIPLLVQTERNE